MEHEIPFGNTGPPFWIFQWNEPTKRVPFIAEPEIPEILTKWKSPSPRGVGAGRGALGYFLGGYVPPGTPNWYPVLNTNSPKIDTPF